MTSGVLLRLLSRKCRLLMSGTVVFILAVLVLVSLARLSFCNRLFYIRDLVESYE